MGSKFNLIDKLKKKRSPTGADMNLYLQSYQQSQSTKNPIIIANYPTGTKRKVAIG